MGIRDFFPPTTKELRFETDASPEDVRRTLEPHVRPPRIFAWTWSGPRLAGVMTDFGFCVRPVIEGRNSFLPVIRGEFEGGNDGSTVVRIAFTPPTFAVLFPVILFLVLANFSFVAIYVLIAQGQALPVLFVGVMWGFGLILVRWGFRVSYPREVERARRLLVEILEPLGLR